jgi:amino acid permease
MRSFFRYYLFPIATFSSGVIGVGFLSLPYITLKVGFLPMVFYFILLTAIVLTLNIMFSHIALKTPDFKRWPGFVEFYFGRIPKKIVLVTYTVGGFGVMLVYLIIGGQFLHIALSPILGGSLMVYTLVFFAAGSICIFLATRSISHIDFAAFLLVVLIFAVIGVKGYPYIKLSNMSWFGQQGFSLSKTDWFLPYGALLFSLWGAGFIPEIEEMVRGRKQVLKRIMVISTLATAAFYALFAFLILSITGSHTSESALVALQSYLGSNTASAALLMGVLTTVMAYVAEGVLLKKIFMYDVGQKRIPSWLVVSCMPLVLLLLGFNSFIPIISFIGGVLLSIDGILIVLIYRKIGGNNIVMYPMIGIFLLGIVYELVYFIK